MQDVIAKLPFFSGGLPEQAVVDDYELVKIESLINSMTKQERNHPDIIDESRIKANRQGSGGRKEQELTDLLLKFRDMRDLLRCYGRRQAPRALEEDERPQEDVRGHAGGRAGLA